jgi:hypothetical protein
MARLKIDRRPPSQAQQVEPQQPPGPWSPTVEVDGAERRTQMRMGTDADSMDAQAHMPIACPVLRALVIEGSVKVDPNGRVQTAEMLDALKAHGMTRPMLEVLRGITYFANRARDIPRNVATQSFDIMHLRSGLTMHNSDSNILSQGYFDEAAFDRFTRHATHGWMDEAAFAAAVRANTAGDIKAQNPLVALTFGQNAVLSEYPVLIKRFGTKDPHGNPAISVEALKAFWKDGKFPSTPGEPGSIGLMNSAVAYGRMLATVEPKLVGDVFRSAVTATGAALEGVRLSTSNESAAAAGAQAGRGAGAAVKCPYLSGAAPMPTPVADAITVHADRSLAVVPPAGAPQVVDWDGGVP